MTYLRINGVDLYSEVVGHGDPVLLLHGGFCSLESLRRQSDALVGDHQVFAFERPGHGGSADTDGPFSYDRGVSDTLAYLDAHQLDSVHVVGYSDGAVIGLLLALDHPERVRSLVAISGNLDPSAFTHSGDPLGLMMLDAPDRRQEEVAERPDAERQHYDRLSPDGAHHGDVVMEKLFTLWTTEPHIDPADLRRVRAPTLVMSGDRDTIRPDHSLLIASSIPGAQLCIVPGATHDLIAQHPDLISTIIRTFFQQVTAG